MPASFRMRGLFCLSILYPVVHSLLSRNLMFNWRMMSASTTPTRAYRDDPSKSEKRELRAPYGVILDSQL